MTSPFLIRGLVEGFYGVYYTVPERNDLIRFLGAQGFNLYVYGPKNDRRHRNRWRESYSDKTMRQFGETVRVAQESGIDFCFALSPGISLRYSSEEDFQTITDKLAAFYRLGVRRFSLLLDDIVNGFPCPDDAQHFKSYAAAQVALCNRALEWLQRLGPGCTLSMCPTEYHGRAPFSAYIEGLGAGLCPEIDVFYTGREICSPSIATADAQAFAEAVGRAPLLWDNYPVNDLAMQPELHVGPYRRREPTLYRAVKGVVVVPMIQPEASKIPLLTIAAFLADPLAYDPDRAWERALAEVAGSESRGALTLFAENSLHSCLGGPEAPRLDALAVRALAALQNGSGVAGPDVYALESYLVCLDEACDHLKNQMDNLALRNNLVPWIELLEYWAWTGLRGLAVLRALERGASAGEDYRFMQEYCAAADKHHKRIGGRALLPLARYVDERMAEQRGGLA